MFHAFILAGYLTSVGLDIGSGAHARAVGATERNPLLPSSSTGQILVSSGFAGATVAGTQYLWTHGHKKVAIGILVGSAIGHGLAARHNWAIK